MHFVREELLSVFVCQLRRYWCKFHNHTFLHCNLRKDGLWLSSRTKKRRRKRKDKATKKRKSYHSVKFSSPFNPLLSDIIISISQHHRQMFPWWACGGAPWAGRASSWAVLGRDNRVQPSFGTRTIPNSRLPATGECLGGRREGEVGGKGERDIDE